MVEIRESLIPDAGLGVFSTQDIDPDTVITEYYGDVFLDNIIPPDVDTGAMLNILGFTTVGNRNKYDASRCGQMINDYVSINRFSITDKDSLYQSIEEYVEKSIHHANVHGIGQDDKHYICSSKSIKKGEELYLNYGECYWLSVILSNVKQKSKIHNLVSKYLETASISLSFANKIFQFKRNKQK